MRDLRVNDRGATARANAPGAAATDRAPWLWPASATDDDIARRAHDLYLARGCEPGHNVDDWLEAERELRNAANSTALRLELERIGWQRLVG